MVENKLKIRGARHHNLKNLDIDIPKNKLIVISGLSGSGKLSNISLVPSVEVVNPFCWKYVTGPSDINIRTTK